MGKVGSAYSKPSTWKLFPLQLSCAYCVDNWSLPCARTYIHIYIHIYIHTYIHTYLPTPAGYVSLNRLPGLLAAEIISHGKGIGGFPGAHIHLRLPFPPITAPAFEPVLRGCQLVTRRRHGSVDSRDIEQASVWPPSPD